VLSAEYDVVVAGGGPAGCAAAVGLGRLGWRVLLVEAERYPVHKMCGEFMSPEAWGLLARLGVDGAVRAAGAVPIRRVSVTSANAVWRGALPAEGIGVSRWVLDPLLFDAATAAGVEGLQGARVTSIEREGDGPFRVGLACGGEARDVTARLVIGAFGKRSRLDRALDRDERARGGGFVAFKMHHEGADLDDWVELHAFDGGYCGMSHVEGGLVNVCLIARASALRESGGSYDRMRDGVMRTNPALAARLERLAPVMERPVSIAQVTFRTKGPLGRGVLMVGDTAAMIAPLCGDGMAMALRAAELVTPLADRYLAGATSFEALERAWTRRWRREFTARLAVGRALQSGLFRPRVARAGLAVLARVPAVGQALIALTRE
jgi:flavin-dependent dehydrogenase